MARKPSIGRATPRPNRAETAVRLFKRQYEKLLIDASSHPPCVTSSGNAVGHEEVKSGDGNAAGELDDAGNAGGWWSGWRLEVRIGWQGC